MALYALFGTLREAVFLLGAFEMEKVFDWELASWKDLIKAVTGPLTGLVGMVKCEAQPLRDNQEAARPPPLPSSYQSSVGSDSSIESPKRIPLSGRLPRIMQLTAAPERTETPSPEVNSIPRALEDAIIRLMQSKTMCTTDAPARSDSNCQNDATCDDSAVTGGCCHGISEFTIDAPVHAPRTRPGQGPRGPVRSGNRAAVATATAGTGLTRVRLSAFSELKEFHGQDASEVKARAWFNRVKAASGRDGMTGEEVCALFGDLMTGPTRQ
ncbi:unnamed protein product [Phytophthora fragariaefolia]|uniref:Unnamed protein product n=1 Tax=Phytophthora fragariaefolia TaxID=1490495 RepID=A0A9W6X6L7_9STRA|nr:unnamed protein product [Phytophthora fragariaefolia]